MMKGNTILATIIFLLTWTVNAQNDTMYVMKNGIITCQISVNQTDLDSVVFYSQPPQPGLDTMYFMKNGVATCQISIKQTDLDSVVFYKPTEQHGDTLVYQLQAEFLSTDAYIARETPEGKERMISLLLINKDTTEYSGLTIELTANNKTVIRELMPLPANGNSLDYVWLAEPLEVAYQVRIREKSASIVLRDSLQVPVIQKEVLIPMSRIYKETEFAALSLRGTNYFPRATPWAGMWTETPDSVFNSEFDELVNLNINTIRTFINVHKLPENLATPYLNHDGSITITLIEKVNRLLEIADSRGIKVMLCLMGGVPPGQDGTERYFRSFIEPFSFDGRILLWDLVNEPDSKDNGNGFIDPANPYTQYVKFSPGLLTKYDKNHTYTIGLAHRIKQMLENANVHPPIIQWHSYAANSVGIPPEDDPAVRNVRDDIIKNFILTNNTPLIIGEFGVGSFSAANPDGSYTVQEQYQLERIRYVIEGSEAAVASGSNLLGVYNWCAFHFDENRVKDPTKRSNGVINMDGTLKPAGIFLRDTYARWKTVSKAPWEQNLKR